jgi:ribosomal-protein-alanine N-acetyltransferase
MFAMWREPDVCRYAGPAEDFERRPIVLPAESPVDSDKIIDFFVRGCAAGTWFRWALLSRNDGQFIGAAGFNSLGACSEYAYHLHPNFWGQGLMSEASRVAFAWLNDQGVANEVEAFIDQGNRASITLATRLGFLPTSVIVQGANRYVLRLR